MLVYNKQFTLHIVYFKLSIPCILALITSFSPTKRTYVRYIYLSPITYYRFRYLLHHLHGDDCDICSKPIRCLQRIAMNCIAKSI